MAEAGNSGTPPAGGAPAGQAGNPNPTGGEGGTPSGGRRLIAGKYETIEDAVEQGIFGMEQAFHKTREDLGKVTRILESVVGGNNPNNPPPNVDPRGGYAPVGSPGRGGYNYPDPYGRGNPQNDPDYIDPTQFIVNPGQVMAQREQRILQRVAGVVENVVANAMVVQEFKRQNPDLVPHERVVNAFMQETDRSKPYAERLADAAQMAKQYLINVRGGGNPPPAGGNFVESPRGGGAPVTPVVPGGGVPPENQAEEEKELYDYIRERNTDIAARFGIKS